MELGYFGKLPSRADFVRYNATAPVYRLFDEWIQGGLRQSLSGQFAEYDRAYSAAGPSSFLYYPSEGAGPLIGVIQPSTDQAGRKYPFYVSSGLDDYDLSESPTSALPFTFSPLFDAAASLIVEAREHGATTDMITEQIRLINERSSFSMSGSGAMEAAYSDTTFGDLCTAIWGGFFESRKYAAFKNVLDLLVSLRDQGQPRFSYGLEFPLASGPLMQTSAAFWLDVCSRLLGMKHFKPTLFINHGYGLDEHPPSMYLYFSHPPGIAFLNIAQALYKHDSLYTLDSIGNRNPAELALSIPADFGLVIESADLPLSQTLDGFGTAV